MGRRGCRDRWPRDTGGRRNQADGESLSVGPLASTQMFCEEPAGAMDQEIAYLTVLGEAETFSVDGDALVIQAGDGQRVVFTRR